MQRAKAKMEARETHPERNLGNEKNKRLRRTGRDGGEGDGLRFNSINSSKPNTRVIIKNHPISH